ncbi:MAG: YggS family pyridoxal phosphate-dependent enzyme [Flavobacteriales bacterium]|nr:YggS family pyridoxal phosphate-dependent enzyme [Flavobacteriales bacterium]|tara:strand:- start:22202 stop:22846 length:645 start_codon:yes stop_codon:yes gene_type:complete
MSVTESISKYNLELGDVELIAVSKTKPISAIMEAYEAGQRHFGENKIQELAAKYEELPKDIQWHMIGTVQTNKIKYIAPFVHMVHGVDRRKVLVELNKQAVKCSRTIKSLLQVQIASEDTKSGLSEGELRELVGQLDDFPNAEVVGLMGMATNTKDMNLVNSEFARLKDLYDELGTTRNWNTLSMGMSGDYKLAIENGSTHVRIGSSIFGARND